MKAKYTATKNVAERDYCKIVLRSGPSFVWSIQFDNVYPLTNSTAFKYTAVKCTAKKYVKLKYILVRSIVFICLCLYSLIHSLLALIQQ